MSTAKQRREQSNDPDPAQLQIEFCERGKLLSPEAKTRVLSGFRALVEQGLVRPLQPADNPAGDDVRVLSKPPSNSPKQP